MGEGLYPSRSTVGRDLSPPAPIYRPVLVNHPKGWRSMGEAILKMVFISGSLQKATEPPLR
jgi:hypothetical protein